MICGSNLRFRLPLQQPAKHRSPLADATADTLKLEQRVTEIAGWSKVFPITHLGYADGGSEIQCPGTKTGLSALQSVGLEFLADLSIVDAEFLEDAEGYAITFEPHAEEQVLRTGLRAFPGLLRSQGHGPFGARGAGKGIARRRVRAGPDELSDFPAHHRDLEAEFLADAHSPGFVQLHKSEQQVLGSDEIVTQSLRLQTAEFHDLPDGGIEIVEVNFTRAERMPDQIPPRPKNEQRQRRSQAASDANRKRQLRPEPHSRRRQDEKAGERDQEKKFYVAREFAGTGYGAGELTFQCLGRADALRCRVECRLDIRARADLLVHVLAQMGFEFVEGGGIPEATSKHAFAPISDCVIQVEHKGP